MPDELKISFEFAVSYAIHTCSDARSARLPTTAFSDRISFHRSVTLRVPPVLGVRYEFDDGTRVRVVNVSAQVRGDSPVELEFRADCIPEEFFDFMEMIGLDKWARREESSEWISREVLICSNREEVAVIARDIVRNKPDWRCRDLERLERCNTGSSDSR